MIVERQSLKRRVSEAMDNAGHNRDEVSVMSTKFNLCIPEAEVYSNVKVKLSRYRPGQALGVPGG
jgi:hypothetical protein